MRDTSVWLRGMARGLHSHLADQPMSAETVCKVELGLYALKELLPLERASSLWVLQSGYPFAWQEGPMTWSATQKRVWSNARHLMPEFSHAKLWARVLELYRTMPVSVRAFEVSDDGSYTAKPVSVYSQRTKLFHDTLHGSIPPKMRAVKWAGSGEFSFLQHNHYDSVFIPPELALDVPQGHSLQPRTERETLRVSLQELQVTAQWMDEEEARRSVDEGQRGHWHQRFSRLRLECPSGEEGCLLPADSLTLDGLTHLIGMVSSGKSTLMDVLAVWSARRGLHITLVVGDVISALNRAQMFARLGLKVAPILGSSNRKRHTERLHRALSGTKSSTDLQTWFEHDGFHWLSTVCPLDGLRSENNTERAKRPLKMGEQPCLSLLAYNNDEEDDNGGVPNVELACPLYSACPTHAGQRELVEASIWIATPASLIYTAVAPQLNPERLRFAELVCLKSDLVVVDEADQVQVQLDSIFNPNQTLVGHNGWLSSLQERVPKQLNQQRRSQLSEDFVGTWLHGHDMAQTATNRIYDLLLQQDELRRWVENDNYFTPQTLFDDLAQALSSRLLGTDSQEERTAKETQLQRQFLHCIEDPFGEENNSKLCEVARLVSTQSSGVASHLRDWIEEECRGQAAFTPKEIDGQARRLELALLVAVLHNRIQHMLRYWGAVEAPLRLEGGGSLLSHDPPDEYGSLIPAPPMGGVLAFQYVRGRDDAQSAGDLRFFRCIGVGRWLLLHLHDLFAGDGVAGPNVVLLSGTSWAGSSPSYHVQAPVAGVLRAPDIEVRAIEKSQFEFFPQRDEAHQPIRISGKQGGERLQALKTLLHQLARRSGLGNAGLLEQERGKLPEGRRRVLLLVGSYEEAKGAYEFLTGDLRPEWRNEVRYLVPDDAQFEGEWRGGTTESQLRRGSVGELAQSGAWLLIAPLQAIERGHNILNEEGVAAIGAAFFLVRPHPRPDDLNFAVHSINKWAVEKHRDLRWLQEVTERHAPRDGDAQSDCGEPGWGEVGVAFRREAQNRWHGLLRMPMRISTLPKAEREAVIWSQMVAIWQVVGRLVRGGSSARVFFCDAAFAPASAAMDEAGDQEMYSLLVGMRELLRPYFESQSSSPSDSALVQTLYGPFYAALENMKGLSPKQRSTNENEEETASTP